MLAAKTQICLYTLSPSSVPILQVEIITSILPLREQGSEQTDELQKGI